MKKLIFILAATLLVTGCATNKCGITEKYDNSIILFAVDSTGAYENPNDPGTFYKMYDTVFVRATQGYDKKGNYKVSYKILNK